MINRERLAQTFKTLVEIDSVSKNEARVAEEIQRILQSCGAVVIMDGSAEKTGSNTGNLIAKLDGTVSVPPMMLSAHMDTVDPGKGITAIFKDGVFTSDGTTILGADDKSAIAVILEVVQTLQGHRLPYGPLEIVLTVCEETGLHGAKHLDYSLIEAKYGYTLDTTDTEGIVTRAPGANKIEFIVHGKDAHAGASPENGINAIMVASQAIAKLQIGRIDPETTCNIGIIQGGIATNIVPNWVVVKGEARSHNEEKLKAVTDRMASAFRETVKNFSPASEDGLPRIDVSIEHDFSRTHIPDSHPVVVLAQKAAANLNRKMTPKMTGGGADANIFFEKGIMTGVLGTGMKDIHTVRESIRLDDMVKTAELILEIIRLHALEPPCGYTQ